ncbi:transcriptional regulator [Pseudooceanicola nanhaiensis]|jgi:DNA-binding IclR family transcriptional regulator|uniref:Transcriptional regulator n=1 Tax=Pseudooceanicola nanhaiensis TaxID=375761 RepID=A0A917T7H8_9RHOB|nr:helix-turn-helix domain-containing protein [Pseudooceanicola nanhaiensis]GGM12318.1 transcriptional regulator [Pseudooceanicola nanhaiensis]
MSDEKVKSAARAFEILDYFRLSRQPRSMSELAAGLGYPLSSTTVLLKTLVKLGYLNYDRRARVYFPTTKVTGLGDWIPKALFGSGQVIDAMHDLHAATGEGIFLGAKNDVYLQYIQTKESIHALRFHIEEGTIRPITKSIAGLVLLATLPPDKLENTVRRANIATPKASDRVKLSDVTEKVAEIRRLGYGYVEDTPFEGGATFAMILPVLVQGQPIALALGGVADRFRRNHDRYLQALRNAVRSVRTDPDFGHPVQIEL